jgi:MFS family permease
MPSRLPRGVWVLGFVSLLMDISSEMIHGLLPVFLVGTLGASALMLGLIEGAGESIALMARMFSGALSDWWGRRKPLALLGYALGAASKPLFALAPAAGFVLAARVTDRIGKGIRGAPRDALIADLTPPGERGAAFGLRQSLDTFGAFLGPLLGVGLMLAWANDIRAVFWVACVPAVLAVALLAFGLREAPRRAPGSHRVAPWTRAALRRLPAAYWWVVAIGAAVALARFSEAFLVLRASQTGLPLAYSPLVLVVMNLVYAAAAYPLGRLADRANRSWLLAGGLALLIAADVLLAQSETFWIWSGITLWGLHMAMTQGLLSAMVADSAPAELRGTAFGFFNFVSGIGVLCASLLAGWLWDRHGAEWSFWASAMCGLLALIAVGLRPRAAPVPVRSDGP